MKRINDHCDLPLLRAANLKRDNMLIIRHLGRNP
jgi:hypothetical protein